MSNQFSRTANHISFVPKENSPRARASQTTPTVPRKPSSWKRKASRHSPSFLKKMRTVHCYSNRDAPVLEKRCACSDSTARGSETGFAKQLVLVKFGTNHKAQTISVSNSFIHASDLFLCIRLRFFKFHTSTSLFTKAISKSGSMRSALAGWHQRVVEEGEVPVGGEVWTPEVRAG